MPSEHGDHLAWLIIAISGQCQDVSVLGNVEIESDMCATRHAFTLFCSMDHDQLCEHVCAHLA